MNEQNTNDVFNRSGLAALSDIHTEVCQETFSFLEEQQSAFLSKATEFRSEEYKWPDDPLHCWSRIWEYPYIYYHISNYVKSFKEGHMPVVADVGSGVTFFPFSLAQLGCEVICTDIDPICAKDILQANERVSCTPGKVNFRLVDNDILPFDDEECDVLYCISVLEHIPNFENTIQEMARILKPGGVCLITCDLDLDLAGNTQLNVGQYERLTSVIGQLFSLLCLERTIHPVDVLSNRNSPYSEARSSSYAQIAYQLVKQRFLKPLLGRKPGYVGVSGRKPLAILGLVLQKR